MIWWNAFWFFVMACCGALATLALVMWAVQKWHERRQR